MTARLTPAKRHERRLWKGAPPWWDRARDADAVALLAALLAERDTLAAKVDTDPDDWRTRVALRSCDAQTERMMDRLGMTPHGRKWLGVANVKAGEGRLAELRQLRAVGDA